MSNKESNAMVAENMRSIRDCIFTVRGIQVMVDWDLAALYGVETRVMNQAVKRNEDRFPERFRFRLSQQEMDELITNCDKSGRLKVHTFKNMLYFIQTQNCHAHFNFIHNV